MLSLLFAVALAFTEQDAQIAYSMALGLVKDCSPRDAGTAQARIASNRILDMASSVGADVRRDVFRAMTPRGEREFVNLYAEFRAADPSARWVVLVSHYDTKPGSGCPGANDGASTSGLLVGLANAFYNWQTPKGNLMLIWTDGEECMESYSENDGFWGSKRAAEYIYQKAYKVQAVLCLDMLGDKDLTILVPSNGTEPLRKIAAIAARRIGQPNLVKLVPDEVKDDHMPFLAKGFKAIDLIDFDYGPGNSYWHTPQDTIENISRESLMASGRLVTELLNILL